MNITAYLATHILADATAYRQVCSLINEKGYEEQAADRLHAWVNTHVTVILSPPVVSHPYQTPWHVWMQEMLLEALHSVDWSELVTSLRGEKGCPT